MLRILGCAGDCEEVADPMQQEEDASHEQGDMIEIDAVPFEEDAQDSQQQHKRDRSKTPTPPRL